ncbi:outer membrane beta-barrel protein [Legionella hackeliae]|uniref:Outer membrane protein OmpA-like transmembrane domain-containing protein n=1 Tax=Legionella hackeliae TaxID=449 RepID=A0A0A8UNJ9_LEGHA|nr:outer membrane beta-barrel protein [Legionella hackeliae]KTD08906.1 OmpA-like transmembrane domain protein [Legionella hackeliae]CEK10338.1 conserved exported protein of unknown function [Legionella hackeliae]STX47068.1 OmpA-like transmembrane domain [Legionella hackeliae]
MITKKLVLWGLLFFVSVSSFAHSNEKTNRRQHFYVGAMGGYGATTWEGLVPTEENQNLALSMSTPIKVREGGGVWGAFTGYEFNPFFAIELSYLDYPDATVSFDSMSLFSFLNDNRLSFKTKTETVDLKAKIMLVIPNTKIRAYSSVGVAGVHRDDMLVDDWRVSPAFGAGINYQLTEHWMGELGGNYTAGYGEAQLTPSDSYFPFLYSVVLRLAYFF